MASSTGAPRTLTEMLRSESDAALVNLLRMRPDLVFPAPRGFSDLASHATTRHSVSCAVDTLNAFELDVATRVSGLAGAFSSAGLAAALYGTDVGPPEFADVQAAVADAVRRLRALVLVWGDDAALRPVRALAAVVSTGAAGGATPAVAGDATRTAADTRWTDAAPPVRPPHLRAAQHQPPSLVDKVAAGSAFECLRRVDVLLEHCAVRPVRLRRDGHVGTRDSRDIARLLDVPVGLASMYLGLAEAAGLLGLGSADVGDVLLPTPEFEQWQGHTLAEQWATLVLAWLENHSASGPAWLKQMCLAAFGEPSEGRVLPVEAVAAWVTWQRPRSATLVRRLTAPALQQATELGLLGLGAVASFAAAVDIPAIDAHLPAPSGEVVLQADLTAVAPGPLTAAAAQELGALADVESRGGATVYRFSPQTLLRGVERGWDAEKILALLTQRSRTPVPQPLDYLVRDVDRIARRQGVVPPVAGGMPPVTAASISSARRAVARIAEREDARPPSVDLDAAQSVVAALRAAEYEVTHSVEPAEAPAAAAMAPSAETSRDLARASPVDTLREAVETGEAVWLSTVDVRGRALERVVTARSADLGDLVAVDVRSGEAVVMPMSRVKAAHILRRTRKMY